MVTSLFIAVVIVMMVILCVLWENPSLTSKKKYRNILGSLLPIGILSMLILSVIATLDLVSLSLEIYGRVQWQSFGYILMALLISFGFVTLYFSRLEK